MFLIRNSHICLAVAQFNGQNLIVYVVVAHSDRLTCLFKGHWAPKHIKWAAPRKKGP